MGWQNYHPLCASDLADIVFFQGRLVEFAKTKVFANCVLRLRLFPVMKEGVRGGREPKSRVFADALRKVQDGYGQGLVGIPQTRSYWTLSPGRVDVCGHSLRPG